MASQRELVRGAQKHSQSWVSLHCPRERHPRFLACGVQTTRHNATSPSGETIGGDAGSRPREGTNRMPLRYWCAPAQRLTREQAAAAALSVQPGYFKDNGHFSDWWKRLCGFYLGRHGLSRTGGSLAKSPATRAGLIGDIHFKSGNARNKQGANVAVCSKGNTGPDHRHRPRPTAKGRESHKGPAFPGASRGSYLP